MEGRRGEGAYIFQHFDLGGHALQLGVILVFELGEDGVRVLASVDRFVLAF